MRLSNALRIAAFLLALPVSSVRAAQERGVIEGTVSDTLGNLLEDVQVGLVGTPHYAVTDEKGAFHLPKVKAGSYTLSMRRLGFDPLTMIFVVLDDNGISVDFELSPTAVRVAPVSIKTERVSLRLRLAGFETRMKTAGVPASHFITRQEIEKRHVQSLTNLIDRMGGRARACDYPNVFLDGSPYKTYTDFSMPAPSGRSAARNGQRNSASQEEGTGFQKLKPLDAFQIRYIEGVEVYSNAAEIPVEFKGGPDGQMNGKCVVLLWTRDH
jgi:hypothetical protein